MDNRRKKMLFLFYFWIFYDIFYKKYASEVGRIDNGT